MYPHFGLLALFLGFILCRVILHHFWVVHDVWTLFIWGPTANRRCVVKPAITMAIFDGTVSDLIGKS
jgi:hypothetical protein